MPVGVVGSVIARQACLGTLHAIHPLLCSWLAFRQAQSQQQPAAAAGTSTSIGATATSSSQRGTAVAQERSWQQLFLYDAPLTELLANAVDLVLDDRHLDRCKRPPEILAALRRLHANISAVFLKLAPLAAVVLPGRAARRHAGGGRGRGGLGVSAAEG